MKTEREKLATSIADNRPSPKDSVMKKLLRQTIGRLSWQVWAVLLVLASGGIGFTATSSLLELPKTPNCPKIFWPIASASMRLYCAELEADKGTVEGLLEAVNLVEALSDNHPLRAEIDKKVENWAVEILDIAEKEYNDGDLKNAIATARKIPNNVQAYNVVAERITEWQSTWTEAEKNFTTGQDRLRESEWNLAFREAVKLLYIDNQYWSTTKYEELTEDIKLAQKESKKLDAAYVLLKKDGIDNWLEAVEDAEKIAPTSYAYQEAQNLIGKAKEKIIKHVETAIDKRNWQDLLYVTDRLPESIAVQEDVEDWQTIASAGSDAEIGSTESLQSAILTAQEIKPSRPLYQLAQDLVGRWQTEIEDVALLEKAREIAQLGTVSDLNAAIAQAELIPQNNPRYQEALKEIGSWTSQVQTIEDRPVLDRAEELAINGTIPALQEAISQASLIGRDRALYEEARDRVSQWQSTIEEQQDRPYLDQAYSLASNRDYPAAIQAARQIQRGRSLYQEARSNIAEWDREIQAQTNYQQAVQIADANTPEALVSAIDIVSKIPASTDVGTESTEALNRWSYELLNVAQDVANASSLREAIRLARTIPSQSTAYGSAQSQIQLWRQMLNPAPVQRDSNSPSLLETNFPNRTRDRDSR
jgi:hypothetical protein